MAIEMTAEQFEEEEWTAALEKMAEDEKRHEVPWSMGGTA